MGVAARPRCRSSGAALTRRAIALRAARKAQHRRSARADTRRKQQLTPEVPPRAETNRIEDEDERREHSASSSESHAGKRKRELRNAR